MAEHPFIRGQQELAAAEAEWAATSRLVPDTTAPVEQAPLLDDPAERDALETAMRRFPGEDK